MSGSEEAPLDIAASANRIAHDLNNLLTVIALNVELARDILGAGHPAQSMLNPALTAANNCSKLTLELLAAARAARAAKG